MRSKRTARKIMPPVHAGEMPREDFLKPLGLSVKRLALRGKRGVIDLHPYLVRSKNQRA
jgi:hypothetical protein